MMISFTQTVKKAAKQRSGAVYTVKCTGCDATHAVAAITEKLASMDFNKARLESYKLTVDSGCVGITFVWLPFFTRHQASTDSILEDIKKMLAVDAATAATVTHSMHSMHSMHSSGTVEHAHTDTSDAQWFTEKINGDHATAAAEFRTKYGW